MPGIGDWWEANRTAKRTIRQETDERLRATRALVVRDTLIAVAAAAVIMLVCLATRSGPNEVTWVFLFPLLIVAIAAVVAISTRQHKATTPELDAARAMQTGSAAVLVFPVVTGVVWAMGDDLAWAAVTGTATTVLTGLAALFRHRRARKG
jgi:fatty acid desaturase